MKEIKRAKGKSWYVNTLVQSTSYPDSRKMYSRPKAPLYIQKTNGSWMESSTEYLTIFMETNFPGCRGVPEVGLTFTWSQQKVK